MDAHEALVALRAAAKLDQTAHGAHVIGVVGPDVPVEQIRAAGSVPLRLRGNPEWNLEASEGHLGSGLDSAVSSILAGILSGAFGELNAIVVSSDCDASQRLYYVLRELRRVQPETAIPPVHLVDVLHLPRESTARYNLRRLLEFDEVLVGWIGAQPDAEALRREIADADEVRALQREVFALRNAVPARISGADAHSIIVSRDRMPREQYVSCLEALLAGADALEPRAGRRVFLTGSDHDRAQVIETIEAGGATVIGEDHGWGASLVVNEVRPEIGATREQLLDALARRYQLNAPTSQRGGILERAAHTRAGAVEGSADLVISYSREKDEAPIWDFAAQRRALAGHGIPAAVILGQNYGSIDEAALAGAYEAPESTDVNGKVATA